MSARLPMEVKLAKYSRIDHDTQCQIWTGYRCEAGYGVVTDGRSVAAYRASYEYAFGPIPEGMHMDHLCRNRPCINPWHLEPVTPAENFYRGESPTAIARRENRCMEGHPYVDGSYYLTSSGVRNCRICKKSRKPPPQNASDPPPPWAHGVGENSKRHGWLSFFAGRSRDASPFPANRTDMHRAYREGWDAAQAQGSPQ